MDPMATKVNPEEPLYGIKAAFSDVELCGDILHMDGNRAMAVSFFHSKHTGAIQNASIKLDKISTWFATANSNVNLVGEFEPRQIDAAEGVTIKMTRLDQPEHQEMTLVSGGRLIIN